MRGGFQPAFFRPGITAALFLFGTTASQAFMGECLLEVDGKTYIDGRCNVEMARDGGFSIGSGGAQPSKYFARVTRYKDSPLFSGGFWNGVEAASEAHDALGDMSSGGGCWVNQRATLCAWQPGQRPADIPPDFRGVWIYADPQNQECKKSDWEVEFIEKERGLINVTRRSIHWYEYGCIVATVKIPQNYEDQNGMGQWHHKTVEVDLTCGGEGSTWRSKEIWHVDSIEKRKVLMTAETKRTEIRELGEKGTGESSEPEVNMYLECPESSGAGERSPKANSPPAEPVETPPSR